MNVLSIPLPFTEELEDRPGFPCRAFRWSVQFDFWTREEDEFVGTSVGLIRQHQFKETMEWSSSSGSSMVIVSLTTSFKFGSEHFWYDGPHCTYDLGYLHLYTTGNPLDNWNCEECFEEGHG